MEFIKNAESIYDYRLKNNMDVYGFEDTGLTENGKREASKIKGDFDIVVLSPARCCQETLKHSKLKTQVVITTPIVDKDIVTLKDYLKKYHGSRICVIFHNYFFSGK